MEQNEHVNLTISYLIETWNELVKCLSQNSDVVGNHHMSKYISII
jgi:hypothetical protein